MTLPELCVRRPVFATMIVMSLVVLGIFSFRDLGVDLFPRADPATVSVTVLLPGASPGEVSSSIVEPLESALSSVSGMDELTATVREGSAQITCRFVLERDLESAAQDVREKTARAMRQLPPQVEPPIIEMADPDSAPVFTVVASASDLSLRTLTEIADKQIKRVLETVDGVGEVSLAGGRAREVHVVLDMDKLNAYGISVDQVQSAVQSENVEVPGGKLEQGKAELSLRTLGRIDATDQFEHIVVATVGGTPITLSDLGRVEDTTETARTGAWLDGHEAVVLDLRRQSGENTVRVIEAVKVKLRQIQATLPKTVKLAVTRDDSKFIYASIASLEEHLMWGALLASVVVLFFIRNIRAVIIASLAIPASIVATFTLMRAMDFTLNNMTLLGLTLAVGIVIDDAIVVLENVFRYIEEKGYTPFDAAIAGTKEVSLAVMATTLSLVVIFLPVAFMTGYARRFINPFGWTMAFAILVSLVVSFTLTPMLSSRFLKLDSDGDDGVRGAARGAGGPASDAPGGVQGAPPRRKTKESKVFTWLDHRYEGWLRWALAHPRAIIGTAVVVFALTFPLNAMVGRSFIPNEDQGELNCIVDGPEGMSLEGMTEIVLSVSKDIAAIPGVAHVEPTIFERPNHSHIQVVLADLSERELSQEQIAERIRKILSAHPSYKPTVMEKSALGGGETGGFPINVNLLGPDLNRLADYTMRLLGEAEKLPSLADKKVTVMISNPEIQVAVDRQRAADLGVRISTIARALRLMVSGEDEISWYREGSEQYPVKMRVLDSQRRDMETIGRLTIPSSRQGQVRIDNVAHLQRGLGPTVIQRFNRQYQIMLMADLRPGQALDEASTQVRDAVRRLNLPPGYSARFGGQTKILEETTTNLILAIGLASIFMYMVLAAQFESFLQPVVIMLALPLSVPFALLTLWTTGRTLNLWSALGVLLLLGIVKKNSILQVDYTNVLRARGVPRDQAIVEACRTRLRPILMTTAAILAGLVPTALGIGIGGAQRSAIAVTIIGGQSLCLFLTLLLVPVAYVQFDSLEQKIVGASASAWLSKISAATIGRWRPANGGS